jgi:hypothetical protein
VAYTAVNPQGDLNNDGVVNSTDLSLLLGHYATTDPSADINNDGVVNLTDLSTLVGHYGETVPATPTHFSTTASAQCGRTGSCAVTTSLPRSESYCASNVTATSWEPRPDNNTANHTQGPASASTIPWGPDTTNVYWANALANYQQVDGHYTGLTTQILQWGACKWGLDEDLLRAVAVQESSWHQSTEGDLASGCAHSFGLTQVRDSTNATCPLSHDAWGGMPYTQNSSALAVDFYGASIRSCYDGDYYDGGSWLYGGQTAAQVAAAHDWNYVLWGCVGSWFSGNWYDTGAVNYINSVKSHLARQTWAQPGF